MAKQGKIELIFNHDEQGLVLSIESEISNVTLQEIFAGIMSLIERTQIMTAESAGGDPNDALSNAFMLLHDYGIKSGGFNEKN